MAVAAPDIEALKERLMFDTIFWAEHCARIVDKQGRVVPLIARPGQLKLDAALEAQRAEGKPMRAIILKARQWGGSTWTAAKMAQRVTQLPNRTGVHVAHNRSTAANLFRMAEMIHAHLPDDPALALKPPIANTSRGRELYFGPESRQDREAGRMGLNSRLISDTAGEVQAGRGFTFHYLHGSEVALWEDIPGKLTALLSAVPDDPETMVVLESTAKGYNEFKDWWDRAEAGESDYAPVFVGWHEEPSYTRRFATPDEREAFQASVGSGPYGEDEPHLIEDFAVTLEQLNWRRHRIDNAFSGDIRGFDQEYPGRPEDAFLATGKQVFAVNLVRRVIARCDTEPEHGVLRQTGERMKSFRGRSVHVPTGAEFRAQAPHRLKPTWKVWEQPEPGEQYVVAVDPAAGDDDTVEDGANHAIQVVNHRTRQQVAEYVSKLDPDIIGMEAFRAALFYNQAWLAFERTGGWGLAMANRVWQEFGYQFVYFSPHIDKRHPEKQADRVGWDTNRVSKVVLEDGMKEALREGTDGIRSVELAREMLTYIRERGKSGPIRGKLADRLMAYMIAQQVAQEKVIKRSATGGPVSTTTRAAVVVSRW